MRSDAFAHVYSYSFLSETVGFSLFPSFSIMVRALVVVAGITAAVDAGCLSVLY